MGTQDKEVSMRRTSMQRRASGGHALVDRLEGAGDGEIVFELDGDALVRERLEDGENELSDA